MADAKLKKIICNVTKLNYFQAYIVYVFLTWKTACNSLNVIYIYEFVEVMVKYEFSQ